MQLLNFIEGHQLSKLGELNFLMFLPHNMGIKAENVSNVVQFHGPLKENAYLKIDFPHQLKFFPRTIYFTKFPPRSTVNIYYVPHTVLSVEALEV